MAKLTHWSASARKRSYEIKIKIQAHQSQPEPLSELRGCYKFLTRTYEYHRSNQRCRFFFSFPFWRRRIPQPGAGDRAPPQKDNLTLPPPEEMGFCRRSGTHPGGEERPASAHRPCVQNQEVLSLNSHRCLYSTRTSEEVHPVLFTVWTGFICRPGICSLNTNMVCFSFRIDVFILIYYSFIYCFCVRGLIPLKISFFLTQFEAQGHTGMIRNNLFLFSIPLKIKMYQSCHSATRFLSLQNHIFAGCYF